MLAALHDLDDPRSLGDVFAKEAEGLLRVDVPQPDGRRMYELLTPHPARQSGEIVLVSDLTWELRELGASWGLIEVDWLSVCSAVVDADYRRVIEAAHVGGLSAADRALVAGGPSSVVVSHTPSGRVVLGAADRTRVKTRVVAVVRGLRPWPPEEGACTGPVFG